MKKSTINALVFIIPLLTLGSLLLVGFATSNQFTRRLCQPSIYSRDQSVTISNGDYNICYSVKALLPVTIDKILINPNVNTNYSANTEIGGLAIYLNSTTVKMVTSLNYHLNSGDELQVNIIMPCTEAHSNEASITIFCLQGVESSLINLQQTPSEPA